MGLIGVSASGRFLRIPDFHAMRGRSQFAVGAWARVGSASGTISFWRQDRMMTPVQAISGTVRWPYWTTTGGAQNTSGAFSYTSTSAAGDAWVFLYAAYHPSYILAASYAPGRGIIYGWGGVQDNPRLVSQPSTVNPMVMGATEGGSEVMPSGTALAECMILRKPLHFVEGNNYQGIIDLAHDPSRFAKEMIFYAPLRSWSDRTELVGSRSYRIEASNSLVRSQLVPGNHPPVERWRSSRTFVVPADIYSGQLAGVGDGRVMQTSVSGSSLVVGLG